MSECAVVVTREQATEALFTRAEDPFRHLVRRFKEEHNLDFRVEDFNNKKLFRYHTTDPDENKQAAFKVVYIGAKDEQSG